MAEALISVLVLNYEGAYHLDDCLSSLVNQTYRPLEIVVVDNGSQDQSRAIASKYLVSWLPLDFNHGFARGNNLGVAECQGEFVVFVNNDMRFAEDFVQRIVSPLCEDDQVFAADALQRSWDGRSDIHGATRLRRLRVKEVVRRQGLLPLLDISQERTESRVDVVQGCSSNLVVRRSMFDALGGFDDRLPAGWEDTEICWRAWLRHWRTVFVPEARSWHKVGASSKSKAGSEIRLRGALGGRLLFSTKHLPWEHAATVWLSALGGLLVACIGGRLVEARVRLAVLREYLLLSPRLVSERRALYRGITPREYMQRMLLIGRERS